MKKTPNSLLTATLIAALLLQAAGGNASSLRRIRNLYKNKEYDRAKTALREELGRLKGKTRIQGILLLAALESDVEECEKHYNEVIHSGRARESLKARLSLAKIHYATGDYGKASSVLSIIPSRGHSKDRQEALYFRALCWKQMGEAAKARRDLMEIDRGRFLYWSYMTLAELDMQEGRIGDAIDRYESIASSHSNPIAGFKLGECYEILGERNKAIKVYRTLMHQFPKSSEAPKAREKIQMISYLQDTDIDTRDVEGGEEGEYLPDERADVATGSPAYTLQIGSFRERENAIRLAEELRNAVGDLRVERTERNGLVWHRVRVGRYSSREAAEAAAARIKEKTGYSSKTLPLE